MRHRQAEKRPAVVVLGAGIAVLGVGSYLLGTTLAAAAQDPALHNSIGGGLLYGNPTARLDRPNLPVNQGARDPFNLDANNSPSLAVNPRDPRNLVVSNRVDTPRFSCGLHVSRNGGGSWSDTEIPIPAGEEPKCYAPDVAFTSRGRLYLSYETLAGVGNVPHAVWVTFSGDGGRTLEAPKRVIGPLAFQVRLAVDSSSADRLYLSWLQAAEVGTLRFGAVGNPILFARSDDAGKTWRGPVKVTPEQRARVVAPSLTIGPNGEVYIVYVDLRDDSLDYEGAHRGVGGDPYSGNWNLVLARSLDRGGTWAETDVEDALVPTERFIVFLPAFPAVAVDPRSAAVYVAYQDGRTGDADVYVWASADRGRTFGPAVRVNDTPPQDRTTQTRPQLAVSPSGRLDVLYYDRRSDPRDALSEVSLQSSYDGAKTFTPRMLVSDQRFDSRIGFGEERGMPDLGSRLGLHAENERALAVWADTRAGTQASGKQDISLGIIDLSANARGEPFLRLGGVALLMAGVALVALGWAPMRLLRRRGGS